MPYYRGDYYRGDYYRGDFWSTLGHIGKGVVDAVTGNFGGAVSEGAQALGIGGGSSGPPAAPGRGIAVMPGGAPSQPLPRGLMGIPSLGGLKNPPLPEVQMVNGRPQSGYHQIKSGPHAGYWTKNRRMNPLNVRALRRADRRARAFLAITRSVVKHYVPKQPKGRSYIHARRRRRK